MKAGLIMLLGLLCLSGCKGEPKPGAGAGTAQGEVLPGAASDAMLPLDTIKSQAPLAPKAEGSDGADPKVASKSGVKAAKAEAPPKSDETAAPAPSADEPQ